MKIILPNICCSCGRDDPQFYTKIANIKSDDYLLYIKTYTKTFEVPVCELCYVKINKNEDTLLKFLKYGFLAGGGLSLFVIIFVLREYSLSNLFGAILMPLCITGFGSFMVGALFFKQDLTKVKNNKIIFKNKKFNDAFYELNAEIHLKDK